MEPFLRALARMLLPLGVALASTSASAVAVAVLIPVTYSPAAPVPPWARDCELTQRVAEDLGAALADGGLGGQATSSPAEGRVLKLTVERVVGAAGGGWSGAKTLSLSIQLLDDGRVLRSDAQTIAVRSLNPLGNGCASLERASAKLSGRIVKWLQSVPDASPPAPPSVDAAASRV